MATRSKVRKEQEQQEFNRHMLEPSKRNGENDILVDSSKRKIKFDTEEEDSIRVKDEEITEPSTSHDDQNLSETVVEFVVKEELDIPIDDTSPQISDPDKLVDEHEKHTPDDKDVQDDDKDWREKLASKDIQIKEMAEKIKILEAELFQFRKVMTSDDPKVQNNGENSNETNNTGESADETEAIGNRKEDQSSTSLRKTSFLTEAPLGTAPLLAETSGAIPIGISNTNLSERGPTRAISRRSKRKGRQCHATVSSRQFRRTRSQNLQNASLSHQSKLINQEDAKRSNKKGKSTLRKQEHLRLKTSARKCSKRFTGTQKGQNKTVVHPCNVCGKVCLSQSKLIRHVRTHTGKKPFECNICNVKLRDNRNLIVHQRIHTGEKPYECNICHKKWTQESNLKRHQLTHTGEKPFECHICHEKFSQSYSLIRHQVVHTGERPFECKICQKKFARKSALKAHLLLHSGEQPFKCGICERAFSEKGNLKRHHKILHPQETFQY